MSTPVPPNAIRAARQRAKLSQSAVAERVGVTKSAVSNWETGQNTPAPEVALVLVKVLPKLSFEAIYGSAA